jgi:PAS domain S-box-containing protein
VAEIEYGRPEEALQESEEWLRLALEAARMGIWDWNILTGTVTWSPQVGALFGLKAGEFAGSYEAYLALIHPADRTGVEQAIAETLAGVRADYHVEHRVVWPDHSLHWLEGKGRVYRDEAGQPVRMAGTVMDITARKRAEEEIRRHATRMEAQAEISRTFEEVGLDYQTVLNTVVRRTAELLGDACVMTLFSDDGQRSFPVAFHHPDPKARAMMHDALIHTWQGGTDTQRYQALMSGNSIYIPVADSAEFRASLEPEFWAYFDAIGISSFIIVPLQVQGRVLGTLGITRDRHGASYTLDAQVLLQDLADRAALTIQNTRLFEAEARRRQEAETLREAIAALTSALDLNQLLNSLLTHLARVIPYDSASVLLREGEYLHAVAGQGFPNPAQVLDHYYSVQDALLFNEIQQTGRLLILADAQAEPRFVHREGIDYIRGWLGVPLRVSGQVIGLLTLDSRQVAAYSQAQAELAQAFANQAAIAIENARLFEAEAQRRQEAEALQDTAAALNSTLDLEEVLDRILANIRWVASYEVADIMLIEAGAARIIRSWNYDRQAAEEAFLAIHYTIAETPNLRQMLETGQPLAISDTQTYPGWIEHPASPWLRSLASAPIRSRGKIVGFLNLCSSTPGFFTTAHAKRLQTFADQAAVALENARLHTQTNRRTRGLAALNKASRMMASTLELNKVLEQAMHEVKTLLEAEGASVLLHDPAGDDLVFAAVADPGPELLVGRRMPLTAGIAGWVMRERQPVLVDEARRDPRFYGHIDAITGLNTGSLMAVPLIFEETIMGVVEVINKVSGAFDPHDLELLESLSHSATLAIKNARLYAETKQRAEHLAVLHELDQAITASLDIDHVYQVFAQQTLRLLPYDFMAIDLVEEDILVGAYTAGEEPLMPAGSRIPLEALGGSRWVIEQGQPLLSPDLVSDRRFVGEEIMIAMGMRSALILPLRVKGQVIGTWGLGRRQVAGYGSEAVGIAQSMAEPLAIAIENAHLFEQVQGYMAELEQRVADRTRELSALYDVTAVANASLDLQTTLERSLEQVLEAMRSQAGNIHLVDETGKLLHLAVQQGLPPDLATQLETLPVGTGLPGWAVQHDKLVIVPDVALDPRAMAAGRQRFQAYAGVPIRARGRMLGVLSVVRARQQPPFNVEEVALLTTIADQVGVVVESARLRQLAEQSAVMAERARLARDLHDSVTQLLYSVNLFAAVGRDAYKEGDMADVSNSLNELEFIAQQALKEMRLLVYELRPLALAQEGLMGALQQRLEAVERRAGVQAQLQGNITLDLPPAIEAALYHIIQEALNNALKHATATAVTVRIETAGRRIELEVTDNGSGFDLHALNDQGGLGLTSMRERVEKLGGTLTLLSKPGEGTKVRVNLEIS